MTRSLSRNKPIRKLAAHKDKKGQRCEYQLPELTFEEHYQCPFTFEGTHGTEPFCIFHQPKLTLDEKAKLLPDKKQEEEMEQEFELKLSELLERLESDSQVEVLDLRGFRFPMIFEFGRQLEKKLDLRYATFYQYAGFGSVINVDEYCDTSRHMMYGDALYGAEGAVFAKGADFSKATFMGDADFSKAIFSQMARFDETTFHGFAWFDETTFADSVSFISAAFRKSAYFTKTSFEKKTDFVFTTFDSNAFFNKTEFNQVADFSESIFNRGADFILTRFRDKAIFESSTFDKKVHFNNAYLIDDPDNPSQAKYEFVNLNILKDADVVIEKVDLSKATFRDTNLELITFKDVTWAKPTSVIQHWFRKKCLWDEFENTSIYVDLDYEKIAENYRQLVLNYEKKRDYDSAEDFHIGEMEMRRKKKGDILASGRWYKHRWIAEWLNSYNLYRVASNYGTSYWQALCVLVILILVFSVFFLLAGFKPSRDNVDASSRVIEYNVLPDINHRPVSIEQLGLDYRDSILFTLSIITFQRERFYEPVGWQAYLCLCFAVLFLTAQAALVLLAVRRRFRR
jgi:uncharacterized protein YjbI with pentapeptide repeats